MLESSWGEKFSKMIKNAISSGLNKVEIMLKPKNLGKLNVDISVKENSTKININAENQESANLLKRKFGKINDLIENRNESFLILLTTIITITIFLATKRDKRKQITIRQLTRKKLQKILKIQ